MTLITLQTDFGTRDAFVASMKGVILRQFPEVTIVDVSHDIPPFDVRAAGLNWLGIINYFPEGTVHVGVIDPEVGTERAIIAAQWQGQWFIAPDNGLLTPLIGELGNPTALYEVTNEDWMLPNPHATFHGRDIFAPVAARLAQGADPAELGRVLRSIHQLPWKKPNVSPGAISGEILYTDNFGNCWSNVRKSHLEQANIAPDALKTVVADCTIEGLRSSYGVASARGKVVVVENSVGYLEVGVVQGHAAISLAVSAGSPIKFSAI